MEREFTTNLTHSSWEILHLNGALSVSSRPLYYAGSVFFFFLFFLSLNPGGRGGEGGGKGGINC